MLERVTNKKAEATNDGARTDNETSVGEITPVTVRNLCYASVDKVLLDRLTFSIPSKSRTVIMGANGAGKSLVLRILHGLISPSSGSVLWNGSVADARVRASQAMVFQRPVLLRRSAAKNIEFVLQGLPVEERLKKVHAILDEANLSHVGGTPARLLSGGEQQRLAIARAIACTPKILFLDEPTTGLDPASIHAVEQMIDTAHTMGVKIILVTHDLGQARRMADDIVFLDRGRVVECTSAQIFFAQPKAPAAQAYLDGVLFLGDDERGTDGEKT